MANVCSWVRHETDQAVLGSPSHFAAAATAAAHPGPQKAKLREEGLEIHRVAATMRQNLPRAEGMHFSCMAAAVLGQNSAAIEHHDIFFGDDGSTTDGSSGMSEVNFAREHRGRNPDGDEFLRPRSSMQC